MIMRGLVEEGLEIVAAVRRRHDGARRNPYNEIECGSYYARSMSAWQLVNAWSGLRADLVARTMAFAPRTDGNYRLPWSAGAGWGELARDDGGLTLSVHGGQLPALQVSVAGRTYDTRPMAAGEAQELR
jgi:hypothetical protein